MRGVNKAFILGYVGQDPETKYLPNGKAVTNISIATSEKWKDKATGDEKEKTEWHSIVFYDKLAEIAGEYLKKGSQVFVTGKLATRKWEDKDGKTCYKTEILANELQILGGKPERQEQKEKPANNPAHHPGGEFDDSDIPF